MQQYRLRLVRSISEALSTASGAAQVSDAAAAAAAVTVLATGRCTRVALLCSLAALQHLQQAAFSTTPVAGNLSRSGDHARCMGTVPTLSAVSQRLVHSRPAVADRATSATAAAAATRHPLPAFTADEGLTAAAAEATQIEVAVAEGPAAVQPSTAAGRPTSAGQASAAGESGPAEQTSAADGNAAARRASAAARRKAARRAKAAKAADGPRKWSPGIRLPPVDYTPAVETGVLDFWRRRGLLLPEEAVTDAAVAGDQRQLRKRILRFAQKSSHHRDVPQLEQRMARWDAAKLAEGWSGDVNRTALADIRALGRDPFTQLGKLKLINEMFGRFGINMQPTPSFFQLLSFRPETLESAVPRFLEAARSWGIDRDPTVLLQKTPTLLQCADFSKHTARVAALRKLHVELDVGRVLWGQPGILKYGAETLQQQWDQLRDAAGLDNERMRTLVEYSSSVLKRRPETLRRRLQDVRRFEAARDAVGLTPPPQFKFPAWLSNMLAKPEHRYLRLAFLLEQAKSGQEAALAQPALTVVELPDARFSKLWPGFNAWWKRHMAADDGDVIMSDSDSGHGSASSADGKQTRASDSSGSDSDNSDSDSD